MIELSFCIPTCDLLGEMCQTLIRSVRETLIGVSHEIIVVENRAPMQGVTDPMNASIRAARGEYIVLSNDDVTLCPGWWGPLRRDLDAGAHAVLPFTVDRDRYGFWLFAMHRRLVDEMSNEPGEFWDRNCVLWYADSDFQARLAQSGRTLAHVADSHILHRETQSHDPADAQTMARIDLDCKHYYQKHMA